MISKFVIIVTICTIVAVLRNISFRMFGVLEITSDCAKRRVFG